MSERKPAPTGASAVRRRMRRARLEAALTGTGTALLLGGIIIVAVLAYVLGERGVIRPGAWAYGLGAGLGVAALKVLGDLFDRDDEAGLWREALMAEFGPEMRQDAEVSRLARQAVEFRVRLAEASAGAGKSERRRIAAFLPRLDSWADAIVRLAREVSALRGEATFQSGLATRARTRRKAVQVQARGSTDQDLAQQLARTSAGLDAQIATAEEVERFVEGGLLKLEHSVAAFGSACSQLVLVLKRGTEIGGDEDLGTRMATEIGGLDRQIALIETALRPAADTDAAGTGSAAS